MALVMDEGWLQTWKETVRFWTKILNATLYYIGCLVGVRTL